MTASIPHDTHLHARTLRALCEASAAHRQAVAPALHDDPAIRAAELDAPVFSIVRGMTFLLVALPSLAHLGRVTTTAKRLGRAAHAGLLDEGPWGHGFVARYYYVVVATAAAAGGGASSSSGGEEAAVTTKAFRTRMNEIGFEDPATGSAASALSCHLSLLGGEGEEGEVRYQITQGVEMGRKSDIEVTTITGPGEKGAREVKEVRLSGTARVVMKGTIEV